MGIIIGADVVPTRNNTDLFQTGDVNGLIGDAIQQILQSADFRIFNLEIPLTDKTTPIDKCGPALSAPKATVMGYRAMGADLLTLGNNHIMDQGQEGLADTMDVLKAQGIGIVGAGVTLQEAQKPAIYSIRQKKIGIYACSEHEFSIAREDAPGANPFDPLESPDHVAQLKTQCDFVIVLYHGGKEHYRYPSPELQKVCRKLVDKGADLVVCQHSHCIGCEEKYRHGTIVYGQGNFLFNWGLNACWDTGLLIHIDEDAKISYIPVVRGESGARLAETDQKESILNEFYERSRQIMQPDFVQSNYKKYAKTMLPFYLERICGINRRSLWFRVANKITSGKWQQQYLSRKYTAAKKMEIQNFIECEAHREVLIQGLKNCD